MALDTNVLVRLLVNDDPEARLGLASALRQLFLIMYSLYGIQQQPLFKLPPPIPASLPRACSLSWRLLRSSRCSSRGRSWPCC